MHTQTDGSLPKPALEGLQGAIGLAKKLGTAFSVGLVGENVEQAANGVAGCGAEKFYAVSGPDFGVSRYSTDILAIEALAKKSVATIILMPGTVRFSRVAPGLALRLDGRIDSHVNGADVTDGTLSIQRWYYRQRMVATLTRVKRPWILVTDAGVFQPFQGTAGKAVLENVDVTVPDSAKRTKVIGIQAASQDAQTIRPEAEILFVAGAGWTKKQADGAVRAKDAEKLILGFLNAAKASLGSSKSLVDQGSEGEAVLKFMSHLNQVGQTGSTPRHPKGLATCCHGEEPHVVGWRFINERRAINLDANCGWAQGKADVLYVADAFKVVEKVNELLAN